MDNTANNQRFRIDLTQLLEISGDDQEFVLEILELIKENTPQLAVDLRSCLNAGDFDGIRTKAHKYKSSVSILNNPEIIKFLNELEEAAEIGSDHALIEKKTAQVMTICSLITTQVEELIRDNLNKAA